MAEQETNTNRPNQVKTKKPGQRGNETQVNRPNEVNETEREQGQVRENQENE